MKRKLERFMGEGPEIGVAARFDLAVNGGVEIVVVAGDKTALQLYVQAVLGLPPLTDDQMEEVLLAEMRHVKGLEAKPPITPTISGNGTAH